MQNDLKSVKKYFSLVKFSHTIFAMPFAMIGYFLGIKYSNYPFDWIVLLKVVLCMVFARNAAMGFNRWLDREIDKKNPRTANREIPSGQIRSKYAIWFVLINCLLFVLTTWFLNLLVFFLSPIALLVILGYSYTKRFTALCHFVLGIGLALAPIGAYLAVTGVFNFLPVIFSFIVLFWVSGFDIIYALQDFDFDKNENLKSVPVKLGNKGALILSTVLHLFSAGLVFVAGYLGGFGLFYWIGSCLFVVLLGYQHFLVKPNDLRKVNMAFFTTNGIASLIFAVFTIGGFYL